MRLLDHVFAFFVLSFLRYEFRKFVLFYSKEQIARIRNFFETEYGNGSGRACLFDCSALVVYHCPYSARYRTRNEIVARMKSTVLNKHRSDRPFTFVEFGFDNRAFRHSVGVGFEFFHVGSQKNRFEQVIDSFSGLCGYRNERDVAAPFFDEYGLIGKLLFYSFDISLRFIHFVCRNYYGNACRLRVVYRFDRLRHYAVVCRYNYNRYIGDLRSSRSHGGESRVSGSVEERNLFAVYGNRIRADMLGYTARFSRGNVCASDFIEKRSFTVVDVPHNRNDGRSFNEIAFVVFNVERFVKNVFRRLIEFQFELDAEIRRNNAGGVVIDRIVDRLHYTFFEEFFGYFDSRNTDLFGKFFYRYQLFVDNRFFDFYGLNDFLLFVFFSTKFSVTALVFVEIFYAYLRFDKRFFIDSLLIVETSVAAFLFVTERLTRIFGYKRNFDGFFTCSARAERSLRSACGRSRRACRASSRGSSLIAGNILSSYGSWTVRAERSAIVFRFVNSRLLTRKFYEIRVFASRDRFFFLLFENFSPRFCQSPCFRFFDRFRAPFLFKSRRFRRVYRLFFFNRFLFYRFFFGLLFGNGFRFYFFFYGLRFDFGRRFGFRFFRFRFFRLFGLFSGLFFYFDDFLFYLDGSFGNFDGG